MNRAQKAQATGASWYFQFQSYAAPDELPFKAGRQENLLRAEGILMRVLIC